VPVYAIEAKVILSAVSIGQGMIDPSTENIILKYALQNAFVYGGKANPKAVQGKVMAEQPTLRPMIREVLPLIDSIVARVNGR
jgi:hypothetical protein